MSVDIRTLFIGLGDTLSRLTIHSFREIFPRLRDMSVNPFLSPNFRIFPRDLPLAPEVVSFSIPKQLLKLDL